MGEFGNAATPEELTQALSDKRIDKKKSKEKTHPDKVEITLSIARPVSVTDSGMASATFGRPANNDLVGLI